MKYGILGPLTILGQEPTVLRPMERAVLVLLLLNRRHVLSISRIVDELWGERPPRSATNLVQQYVSRVRRYLLRCATGQAGRDVRTHSPGYVLECGDDDVDAAVFESGLDAARGALAAGELDDSVRLFEQGLALWRGAALVDVQRTPTIAAEADRLEEQRLQAVEDRLEAGLRLGGNPGLIGELTALIAAHPYRERLRGQVMLALYHNGRQAEALEVYRATRQLMVDELGVEPSENLQHLERDILNAAAVPAAYRQPLGRPLGQPGPAGPCQLPPRIADFTGRAGELARVRDLVSARDGPAIVKIVGKPGVGKTALAVQAAHRLRDQFPDGQLFVNLRGMDARPLDPASILARLLRVLDGSGMELPESLDERNECFRVATADRRILIVLDNCADEAQIRPLLPGSPECAVIVTSRRSLAGLEGAHHLILDALGHDESVELLSNIAGTERCIREPKAAADIVRLCGRLPLAVRISGAKLVVRPSWTLARLAQRLTVKSRLDELAVGDLAVRVSIAASYESLQPTARRAFRRIALLESPDFPAWACAVMVKETRSSAERLLDQLAEQHLLETAPGSGGAVRYSYHDVLRLFARERAHAEDPPSTRRACVVAALMSWLACAQHAVAGASVADTGAQTVEGLAWLEDERAALLAAIGQAAELAEAECAWRLARLLAPLCAARGYTDDWRRGHDTALAVVRAAGDHVGEAHLLLGLGDLNIHQDRYDDAAQFLVEARARFTSLADADGEAQVLLSLGTLHRIRGRQEEAASALQGSLARFRTARSRTGECLALYEMALMLLDGDDDEAACDLLKNVLGIAQASLMRRTEGYALRALGITDLRRGDRAAATVRLQAATDIFAELGDQLEGTHTRRMLARIGLEDGEMTSARAALEGCLQVFRDLRDRHGQAHALDDLSELHRKLGRTPEAERLRLRAASLWADLASGKARIQRVHSAPDNASP
jgi:DNA-binding SARP family transcriptional activator/tetratricopeptide (TPR) repeat protein